MMYSHEDERLNNLLGNYVEITFFDNELKIGILEKSKDFNCYKIDNLHFKKSHVKKIKQLKSIFKEF